MVGMQTIPPVPGTGPDDPAQMNSRFGLLLGAVYRQWRRQVDLGIHDLGLSDASRMPLLILYAHPGPMRQKDLAAALHLDTSSLVRPLSGLRRAGLVDWACADQDRRTKCIALTPAGRDTATRILQLSLTIEATLLSDLTPDELRITRHALEKISQRFNRMGD